jgi:hypothetical protein
MRLSDRRKEQKWDLNLLTVAMIPLYARPDSQLNSLNIMFKTENQKTSLSFGELKQVHKFQHILTDYKVYDYYEKYVIPRSLERRLVLTVSDPISV